MLEGLRKWMSGLAAGFTLGLKEFRKASKEIQDNLNKHDDDDPPLAA
jgi:hypothetical protein